MKAEAWLRCDSFDDAMDWLDKRKSEDPTRILRIRGPFTDDEREAAREARECRVDITTRSATAAVIAFRTLSFDEPVPEPAHGGSDDE